MAENYYEILGITEEEKKLHGEEFTKIVNQKYKTIARKNHPDALVGKTEEERKKGEETFKKANEAKDILSDETKRRQYDLGGNEMNWEGFNPFGGGFGPFGNGFNPFGDGFNPFGGFQQENQGPIPENGRDCNITIELSLKEALEGCIKNITYERYKSCSKCNGTGSADGKENVCPHCNGSGRFVQTSNRGNAIFQQVTICPHCHGSGKVISTPCSHCKGSGFEREKLSQTVNIPKGLRDGMSLKTELKGNDGKNGGRCGNLILTIIVKKDDKFIINENNLIYNDRVNFADALLGYEKTIKTPTGEDITIKAHQVTKDREEFVTKGKGMPIIDNYGRILGYGDLIYVANYTYPSKITEKQKILLEDFKKSLEN